MKRGGAAARAAVGILGSAGWEEAAVLPDFTASLTGPAAAPLLAGLERGWVMVPRAVLGEADAAPVTIDMVLLHPARGVALLQVPPRWTPDAAALLRRRLAQAQFAAIFPGFLPVVHASLPRGAPHGLPQLLAEAFAAQPPLDLAGGDAWMPAAWRALLEEAPGLEAGAAPHGRRPGLAGLALVGALGAAFLVQWFAAPPPDPTDPPGMLERLATATAAPAGVWAARPAMAAETPPALLHLPDPELPEPPPAEDAKAVDVAEALLLAAPPSPGVPDILAAPAVPHPATAPPDPPVIAAPPGLEPGLPIRPVPAREETTAPARPAPGLVGPAPVEPSLATAPPASLAPAPPRRPPADPTLLAGLLRRGDALLALGDVSGARRFYERAAEAGSAAGARAVGRTHDPAVLAGLGVRGIRSDPAAAAEWYRRADILAPQERPVTPMTLPRRSLLLGAATSTLVPPALAQGITQTLNTLAVRANAGTVGIISGGPDGTYMRIAADLAAVLDDDDALRVLPILGKGSLQNIADILVLRGVDIGVVQSDVLAFARREKLLPGVDSLIQYIAKLYDEEVHVLARRDIDRIEDLAGKPVNVDVRGSGTAMTASLLFDALDIPVVARNEPQDAALGRLRRGEIAALVYVAGKPARLFGGIPAESGLRLLPVPATPALLETYLPAEFRPADYPTLVPDGGMVETIAVGAVMAVYAWPASTERHRKVARFVEAFTAKFPDFLQPPRHPKWREVDLAAQVPGWTRFNPVAPAPVPTRLRPFAER